MKKLCVLVLLASLASLAQAWTVEGEHFTTGGWNVMYNSPMSWDVWDDQAVSGGVGAWWLAPENSETIIQPGGVNSCETMKWSTRPTVASGKGNTNRYAYAPDPDPTRWGVAFIDPSWSGEAADVAKIASYISPGYLFGQNKWGGQGYHPTLYPWEKQYYNGQARLAVENANSDTILRVRSYAFSSTMNAWDWDTEGCLTLISYTDLEIGLLSEHSFTDFLFSLAKADVAMGHGITADDNIWFECEILNGNENTKVYIDELRFISDQTNYGAPDWVLVPEPATLSILALGGLLLRLSLIHI